MTLLVETFVGSSMTFSSQADQIIIARGIDNVTINVPQINYVTVTGDYRLYNLSDDTIELKLRLMNGATVMAAADAGGTFQSFMGPIGPNDASYTTGSTRTPIPAPYDTFEFTYFNSSASQADWDATTLEGEQVYTNNMGGDGGYWSMSFDYLVIGWHTNNREILASTGVIKMQGREASVAKWIDGDTVKAIIGQTGGDLGAVTGATGWTLDQAVTNGTARLEVWTRVMDGSDSFNWTIPATNRYIHYETFGVEFNVEDSLTMTTGSGTTVDTPAGTVAKKYGRVASYVVAAPSTSITLDGILDESFNTHYVDDSVAMGGGTMELPLAVWQTIGNHPGNDDVEDTEGFGVRGSFIMPGGGTGGGARRATTYRWDGTAWAVLTAMPASIMYASATGSSADLGFVVSGYEATTYTTKTMDWNGTAWATGDPITVGAHDASLGGSTTDCIFVGGKQPTLTDAVYEYNGSAWSVGAAHGTPHEHHKVGGVSGSAAYAHGGLPETGEFKTYNGTSWTTQTASSRTRYQHSIGGPIDDLASVGGAVDANSGVVHNIDIWNGSSWMEGIPTLRNVSQHLGTGSSSGSQWIAGGGGSYDRRGEELYAGNQTFTHELSAANDWVGVTISRETDIPRDVVCSPGGSELAGNHAAVGLHLYTTQTGIEMAGTPSFIDSGIAAYPIRLEDSGGINGTTGEIVLVGTLATIDTTRNTNCTPSAIELVGGAATVLKNHFKPGITGAIELAGTDATIFRGVNLTVSGTSGASEMAGTNATVLKPRDVGGVTSENLVVGTTAQVGKATFRDVTCQTGAIELDYGVGSSAVRPRVITADPAAILLTGNPATIDWHVIALPEAIIVQGTPAVVSKLLGLTVTCTTGAIELRSSKGGDNPLMGYKTLHTGTAATAHGQESTSGFDESMAAAAHGDWNDADYAIFGGGKVYSQDFNENSHRSTGTVSADGDGVTYDISRKLFNYTTINFDGTDSFLQHSYAGHFYANDHFVAVLWIYPDDTTGSKVLWTTRGQNPSTSGGLEFVLDGTELNLYGYDTDNILVVDSSATPNTKTIVANEWQWVYCGLNIALDTYHIAVGTPNGPTLLDKTFAKTGAAVDELFTLRWGRGIDGDERNFKGNMTDMSVSPPRRADGGYDPSPTRALQWLPGNAWNKVELADSSQFRPLIREYSAVLGGWAQRTLANNDGPNDIAGGNGDNYTELHRLDKPWTLEGKFVFDDVSDRINIWSTSGGPDEALVAGLEVTLETDLSIKVAVRRFNQTNALTMQTATSITAYDTAVELALTWSVDTDTMILRRNGAVVVSGSPTETPDPATTGPYRIHTGRAFNGSEKFEGLCKDWRYTRLDRYGDGSENYTPWQTMSVQHMNVRKDREILRPPSAAIVIAGTDATITFNPSRFVSGVTGAIELAGTDATVETITNFPREVTCTTGANILVETAAIVLREHAVIAQPEAIVLSAPTAAIQRDRLVTGLTEELLLDDNNAQVTKGVNRDISAQTGVILLTEGVGSVGRERVVGGITAEVTITGTPAEAQTDREVAGVTETIVLSANPAEISTQRNVVGVTGVIDNWGDPAVIGRGRTVVAVSGAITISSQPAGVSAGRDVDTTTQANILTGNPAQIIKGLFGVIEGLTEEVVMSGNPAHVSKRTNVGTLPSYKNVGAATIVHQTHPDLLSQPHGDVRVLTGVGIVYGLDEPDATT